MEVCVGTSNDKYFEYITNVKNNTAVVKQNWCEKESSGKSTSNNTNTCSLHKNDYISENVRRVPTIDASIGLEAAHSKNVQSLKSDALAHFTKASDNVSNHRYFVFEHNYGSTRNNTKTDKSSETKFGCSAQSIGSTKNHMKSANVENVKHTYVEDLGSEKENRIIFTSGKKNTTSSQQVFGGRDTEGEVKNANCFKLTSPGLLRGSEGASVEGNGVIDEPKPQQKKSDFNSPPGTPKLLKPPSLEGFGSDVSNTNPFSQCDILRLLQEHSGSQHCTTEKIFHDHTYCKTKISPQSSYFCRLCDKCLEGMDKTMDHLESCHLHVMQCILCPSSFDRRPDLIFHVAKHCPNSLTCEKCQLYFRDKESYERHNETCKCPQTTRHSDKNGTWRSRKTMLCHICGKELIRHSLGSHMRVHNRPNSTVKCKLCNQDFSNKGILQFHMRVHGGTYTYSCRLCSKTFSDMDSYRAHISSAHETRYICEICGKACVFKTALYAHRRRFHKPKVKSAPVMVRCEICKKNVSKKEYTTHFKKMHIMTNEDRLAAKLRLPNQRMCEFCGKIFTYNSLRSHAKRCRESQGKPLRIKCRECDAYFPSSKALRLHMWNLGHKVIYNCRFCLRTFNNQFSYKKHLNSEHEKGYACHLCDKSFVFKASYRSHMRAHNPNYVPKKILVNCELCDKSMTKQYYYKHLIKQHPAS